jgi:pilus assembly protein Flp/PilA
MRALFTLMRKDDGQALVEYALILALVSVAAIAILTTLGENIVTTLTDVADAL